MIICGTAWRYHGNSGISRGYLPVHSPSDLPKGLSFSHPDQQSLNCHPEKG